MIDDKGGGGGGLELAQKLWHNIWMIPYAEIVLYVSNFIFILKMTNLKKNHGQ